MHHDITQILTNLINGTTPLRQVHFANSATSAPELALQVDFPRLEIAIEGSMKDRLAAFYSRVMFYTSRLAAGIIHNGKHPQQR